MAELLTGSIEAHTLLEQINKIKWSSDEYTLTKFVDLFPLPQVVRIIKTNLKGNNERKGQPEKMLLNDVFILHSEVTQEVIRATDSLKNEFYLPHDSSAKVEVIWKDYKKFYDNVEELFNHFPPHVLVVEKDETLGIKKDDVLKLKRKIKIREKYFLKCAFLDANRADVDIPFNYKGLFKTLGELTSENIPLKEAVEFCRLPRTVKFIDDKLKIKRIDGSSKCPSLLNSLEHVTLHEVITHIDVIASQFLEGQVFVSSMPLVEEVIVNAPTVESRSDPDYTHLCQAIDKKTTADKVKEIGILHQHWIVFQGNGTKGSSSLNQQLLNLASLRNQEFSHLNDDSASGKSRENHIPVDKEAPLIPPKMHVTFSKEPPVIPPRIPIKHKGQSRNLTPPVPRRRAASDPEDPSLFATFTNIKPKTLPRVWTPSQATSCEEKPPARSRFTSKPDKEEKPPASYQAEEGKLQNMGRNPKFGTDTLEGEDGYVKMTGNVTHLSKYHLLCGSIEGQPNCSNFASDQEQHLISCELKTPKRERSRSDMETETRLERNKGQTRPQNRRSYNPQDPRSQSQGENRMPADSTHYDSEDAFLKVSFEQSEARCGIYSDVPSLMVKADRRNQLSMLKHPQEKPKAPPGLDFINSKNIRSWNSPEVLKFLKFLNLEKYQKVFKQRKIDGEMLANLDKEGMHELHIKPQHAVTIMKLVQECIKHENCTVP